MSHRVLHIMAGADFGGAETAFVDLIAALSKRGVKQRAIIRTHPARARWLHEVGIEVRQAPFRKFFDWQTRRVICQAIRDFQPHIVQTWMDRATTLTPSGPFVHVGWMGGYYKIKYYKQCDYIVGVTPGIVHNALSQGWPAEKAAVLRTFSVIEEASPLSRQAYDTPEKSPLLLALGRLHSDKAYDVLLKALVHVPDAFLWIAGDGELRHELPVLAEKLKVADRVRFLGWRNDRAALLKTCDVCVFPSRVEPFGTVIVEAWAYKVPLVTAASAGPKAHVHHKKNGLIVPIDDVAALAECIRLAIDDKDLTAQIVAQGWQDYQALFTEEATAQSYLNFYQNIAPLPSSKDKKARS